MKCNLCPETKEKLTLTYCKDRQCRFLVCISQKTGFILCDHNLKEQENNENKKKINKISSVKTEVDLLELPNCLFRAYISNYIDNSIFPTNYISIDFDVFTIVATTPKGVWISNTYDKRLLTNAHKNDKWKWVSLEARKRFAYPTKKEAMNSLRIRKQRHLYHLQHQIHTYTIGLEILEIYNENQKEENQTQKEDNPS